MPRFSKSWLIIGVLFIFCKSAIAENTTAATLSQTRCAACHGADGNTTNPIWPKLAGQNTRYLLQQLMDFKQGPTSGIDSPIMQSAISNLTDQDLQALAEYYANLPRTIGAAQPKLVALGQQLYRGGDLQKQIPACMACHGPNGLGNAPAGFPALSGQNADYVSAQLKAFRTNARRNDLNAMMREIAAKMSDEEIAAVASYISGLH